MVVISKPIPSRILTTKLQSEKGTTSFPAYAVPRYPIYFRLERSAPNAAFDFTSIEGG